MTNTGWKQWLKLSRLIPLITVIGAGITIVLSFLGTITLTEAEQIIIALLLLLAADALTERLSILERIELNLGKQKHYIQIESRSEFSAPFDLRLQTAQEVWLLGKNLIGVTSSYHSFFGDKARGGCNLRFLITDPDFYMNNDSPESWHGTGSKTGRRNSEIALENFRRIMQTAGPSGVDKVQIGYLPFPPPYSLLITDPEESRCKVQLEFYTWERKPHKRPHFVLTRDIDEFWVNYFIEEFKIAWSSARKYEISPKTPS
jgi:hypothetical protein